MARHSSLFAKVSGLLAAVLLGLSLLTGQFLFGGYGLLIFSLPTYAILALAGLLGGGALLAAEPRQASPLCLFLGAGAVIYCLGRNAVALDHRSAFVYSLLLVACSIAYLLWCFVFRDNRTRGVILVCLLLGGAIELIFVAVQILRHPGYHPLGFLVDRYAEWLRSAQVQRACGLQINSNALAWALNAVTFMGLGAILWARGPLWARVLVTYVCLLSLTGTVLTASRGGLISLGVGLVVFILLSLGPLLQVARNHSRRHVVALIVLVIFLLATIPAILALNQSVATRMASLLNDVWRVQVSERTFLIGTTHPFFGLGPHGLPNASRAYIAGEGGSVDFAHDDWVQLFADYGAVGFFLAVLFVAAHCWNGWKTIQQISDGHLRRSFSIRSNRLALTLGALAMTAAFATHSWFDFNTQLSGNVLFLACALGILASREWTTISISTAQRLQIAMAAVLIGSSGWLGFECLRSAEPEWRRLEADNAWTRQDFPTLQRATEQGLAAEPRHSELNYLHGLALLNAAGQTKLPADYDRLLHEAEIAFSVSLQSEPDETSPKIELANVLGMEGRLDEAIALDYATISQEPSHADAYMNLGSHLEAQGDLPAAQIAYQRAWLFIGGQNGFLRSRALDAIMPPLSERKTSQ